MKRDMNLVRSLLLMIEADESQHGLETEGLEIEGWNSEQIHHHALILLDAGFITAWDVSTQGGDCLCIQRLTWAGHEFLDVAREPTRWQKAMSLAQNAGGVSLPVLQGLLTQLLSKSMGI